MSDEELERIETLVKNARIEELAKNARGRDDRDLHRPDNPIVGAAGDRPAALPWFSRRSAALRHRVLALALLASVAVVPLSFISPAVNITLPERTGSTRPPWRRQPKRLVTSPPLATAAATLTRRVRNVVPFVLIWLAGVVVAGGLLAASVMRIRAVAARASRVEDGRWLTS